MSDVCEGVGDPILDEELFADRTRIAAHVVVDVLWILFVNS